VRRRAAGLAALAALAALIAGCGSAGEGRPAAAGPVVPRGFLGIVSEDAFARPGAYRAAQMRAQAAAGVTVVRQTFSWKAIETAPGTYDLATYDAYVADAARAGLTVLPILFGPPAFRAARPAPGATATTTAPPRDPRAMARFATVLERRYGSRGTLWREHPELPHRPVTAWQVWNEPNLPVYWGGRTDAAAYVALLKVVGAALRAGDPKAEVVTAGLPQSKLGVPFETYLKRMYAAGAYGTFDVLAINAYSRRVTGMEAAILGARRILASAEQGDLPIWVTEFGWATRPGPRSAMTVGPKTQSRLLATALRTLAGERQYLGLRGVVYYAWRDAPPYPGGKDFWGLHTGLLTRRGRAKPALAGLRAVTCAGSPTCRGRSAAGS
jgi:hypothetical protein